MFQFPRAFCVWNIVNNFYFCPHTTLAYKYKRYGVCVWGMRNEHRTVKYVDIMSSPSLVYVSAACIRMYTQNYCVPQIRIGESRQTDTFSFFFPLPNMHTKHRSTSITPSAPFNQEISSLYYYRFLNSSNWIIIIIIKKRRKMHELNITCAGGTFFLNSKTVETQTQTYIYIYMYIYITPKGIISELLI